jgi:hypothetical protein
MTWLYAIGIGVVAGVVVGALAEQVAVPPLLRSVASAFLAGVLGAAVMTVVGLRYLLKEAGLGSVGVGGGLETLLFLVVMCLVVAGAHTLLDRVRVPFAVVQHRPIIFGCAAGLFGALSAAWGLAAVNSLAVDSLK